MSGPQPRPAESNVSVDQSPREQSDDADMGDPESDRRRTRESVVEERGTKRGSGSMSLMTQKVTNGWRPKSVMGANSPSSQTRSVLITRLSVE